MKKKLNAFKKGKKKETSGILEILRICGEALGCTKEVDIAEELDNLQIACEKMENLKKECRAKKLCNGRGKFYGSV